MAKITLSHIEKSYEIAVKVYKDKISLKKGLDILVNFGMNRNSASDYVYNYGCMVEGKLMTRNASITGTRYYLEKILKDNGTKGLENALISLSRHLDYYEQVSQTKVVKRREIYDKFLTLIDSNLIINYPDEIDEDETFIEGKSKKVSVNVFERNPIGRRKCIEHFGCNCQICGFNFAQVYGNIGKDFIHVHHIVDISTIDSEYKVDPIKDLIPVCPNCHAMLHRKRPAYNISEIKKLLNEI